MDHTLKGNWGNRDDDDFLYQIGFDFVAQLEEVMKSTPLDRAGLAKKLGVSKGRVSQILNNPGNLTLKLVVQYARALDRKVAIVAYDDDDSAHTRGPVHPQVFVACWEKDGKPTDMFSIGSAVASTTGSQIDARFQAMRVSDKRAATISDHAETGNGIEADIQDLLNRTGFWKPNPRTEAETPNA
jgi:hypothetical protein